MSDHEWPHLTAETQDLWDRNAGFWDNHMGETSNDFHNLLVRPATERLLDLRPGERVLDVGCGNGNFSRRLSQLGVHVLAIDFSEAMLDRARARTGRDERIDYRAVDAADRARLLDLGRERFDAAVANMVLMDMAAIAPLFEALRELLRPGGRFVFSVCHPCFQAPGAARAVEEEDRDGEIVARLAIRISDYITPVTHRGLSIVGQPAPTRYFHRPVSLLFEHGFRAGLILDGLEEPAFDLPPDPRRALSWANFSEIPPVLVARMRRS